MIKKRKSFSWNGFSGNEQDLKGDGQVDDDTYFHFLSGNYTPTSTNHECKKSSKHYWQFQKIKSLLIRNSSLEVVASFLMEIKIDPNFTTVVNSWYIFGFLSQV